MTRYLCIGLLLFFLAAVLPLPSSAIIKTSSQDCPDWGDHDWAFYDPNTAEYKAVVNGVATGSWFESGKICTGESFKFRPSGYETGTCDNGEDTSKRRAAIAFWKDYSVVASSNMGDVRCYETATGSDPSWEVQEYGPISSAETWKPFYMKKYVEDNYCSKNCYDNYTDLYYKSGNGEGIPNKGTYANGIADNPWNDICGSTLKTEKRMCFKPVSSSYIDAVNCCSGNSASCGNVNDAGCSTCATTTGANQCSGNTVVRTDTPRSCTKEDGTGTGSRFDQKCTTSSATTVTVQNCADSGKVCYNGQCLACTPSSTSSCTVGSCAGTKTCSSSGSSSGTWGSCVQTDPSCEFCSFSGSFANVASGGSVYAYVDFTYLYHPSIPDAPGVSHISVNCGAAGASVSGIFCDDCDGDCDWNCQFTCGPYPAGGPYTMTGLGYDTSAGSWRNCPDTTVTMKPASCSISGTYSVLPGSSKSMSLSYANISAPTASVTCGGGASASGVSCSSGTCNFNCGAYSSSSAVTASVSGTACSGKAYANVFSCSINGSATLTVGSSHSSSFSYTNFNTTPSASQVSVSCGGSATASNILCSGGQNGTCSYTCGPYAASQTITASINGTSCSGSKSISVGKSCTLPGITAGLPYGNSQGMAVGYAGYPTTPALQSANILCGDGASPSSISCSGTPVGACLFICGPYTSSANVNVTNIGGTACVGLNSVVVPSRACDLVENSYTVFKGGTQSMALLYANFLPAPSESSVSITCGDGAYATAINCSGAPFGACTFNCTSYSTPGEYSVTAKLAGGAIDCFGSSSVSVPVPSCKVSGNRSGIASSEITGLKAFYYNFSTAPNFSSQVSVACGDGATRKAFSCSGAPLGLCSATCGNYSLGNYAINFTLNGTACTGSINASIYTCIPGSSKPCSVGACPGMQVCKPDGSAWNSCVKVNECCAESDGTSCSGTPGKCCGEICDGDGVTANSGYDADCRANAACLSDANWGYASANEGSLCGGFNCRECGGGYCNSSDSSNCVGTCDECGAFGNCSAGPVSSYCAGSNCATCLKTAQTNFSCSSEDSSCTGNCDYCLKQNDTVFTCEGKQSLCPGCSACTKTSPTDFGCVPAATDRVYLTCPSFSVQNVTAFTVNYVDSSCALNCVDAASITVNGATFSPLYSSCDSSNGISSYSLDTNNPGTYAIVATAGSSSATCTITRPGGVSTKVPDFSILLLPIAAAFALFAIRKRKLLSRG